MCKGNREWSSFTRVHATLRKRYQLQCNLYRYSFPSNLYSPSTPDSQKRIRYDCCFLCRKFAWKMLHILWISIYLTVFCNFKNYYCSQCSLSLFKKLSWCTSAFVWISVYKTKAKSRQDMVGRDIEKRRQKHWFIFKDGWLHECIHRS